MRPLRGLLRDERGSVATLIGLFFMLGIVLASASLSIDAGRLMFERRELQNGADAAAFALAQNCAMGPCAAGDPGVAGLAAENAKDGLHTIANECGSASAGLSSTCGAGVLEDINQCPPVPSSAPGLKYVEVTTETLSPEGGFITNLLARVTDLGPDPQDTATLRACARVAWGPFTQASVAPVVFSTCELEQALATAGYGNNPFNPSDPYRGETALAFNYKVTGHGTTNPCAALGHSGMDTPGGFGWLAGSDCLVPITAGNTVAGQPGASGVGQGPCIIPGTVLLLPIYDGAAGSGSGTTYHLEKFAAFYVTAVESPHGAGALPGHPGAAALAECKLDVGSNAANPKCIYGMFLDNYVIGDGEIDPSGDPDGPVTIQPMG